MQRPAGNPGGRRRYCRERLNRAKALSDFRVVPESRMACSILFIRVCDRSASTQRQNLPLFEQTAALLARRVGNTQLLQFRNRGFPMCGRGGGI